MAEAFLQHYGGERFSAYSAGLAPSVINPYTLRVMDELGFDMAGHRAKSVRGYPGRMRFAYVMTVCAKAEANCPSTFSGFPVRLAWQFDDPAAFDGDKAAQLREPQDCPNTARVFRFFAAF